MLRSREDVTNLIRAAKVQKGITWKAVSEKLRASKEWTTAACLGQMAMTKEQAEKVADLFDLPENAIAWLQVVPQKEKVADLFDLPENAIAWLQVVPQKGISGIPTDPTIYRLYEVMAVYGTTIKELIAEEFGDGIMSAIDFKLNVARERNEAGDRVTLVLSGKFLPYQTF
ncbi:unnamed protein product [Gongylonema pulchrum]|uniref:Cyanate hydratase n=1 Tax=Gongylonema pulchrum TaxID=637853 RepID=A0A183EAM5_9BILA|nr:unnamed protein product [Gongylonema pulchrum]